MLLLLTLLLLFAAPAYAQAENVLRNPGFEGGFTYRDDDPLVHVGSAWIPWYRTSNSESAPAWQLVKPVFELEWYWPPTDVKPIRVRDDNSAQLLHSFYATWDAGILQEIEGIEIDSWLRFSVFAWIWSSKLDDPNVSEQDGDVYIQVGIDPDGGTDPQSEDIVWSELGYEFYDGWREYVVVTQAASDTVTVFIRAQVNEPVRNNYVWLDETSLVLDAFDADVVAALAALDAAADSTPTATRVPVFHILLEGENLEDVAWRYGVSADAILRANSLDSPDLVHTGNQLFIPAATPAPTATPEPDPDFLRYVVRSGDTFSSIALLYGIDMEVLRQLNPDVNINLLEVGQELNVPAFGALLETTRSYTVRRDDTLQDVALRFNVSVESIARANNISVTSLLEPGQVLIIP